MEISSPAHESSREDYVHGVSDNCIFLGSVDRLGIEITRFDFIPTLASKFRSAFGQSANSSQEEAWRKSIPLLVTRLQEAGLGDDMILIEYRLPFEGERCDAVILGRSGDHLRVLVVELKQWDRVDLVGTSGEVVAVGGQGLHAHPSYQAANYAGKIRNFHSLSDRLQVNACAYLHNVNSNVPSAQVFFAPQFQGLLAEAPLFAGDQTEAFEAYLKQALGETPATESEAKDFAEGRYVQSKQFFDGIVQHAADIAKHVTENVVESGWGLSDVQLQLKNDVLQTIADGRKKLFLVHGEPGSGKTLLAVHLLLEVLPTRKQVVMGLVNNRLMTALRSSLDKSFRGASGSIKYFTPRYRNEGVANAPADVKFDVVICDEGQRMSMREMTPILQRAPIVVIFYDQYQRLLPVEQGTRDNFLSTAGQLGLEVEEYHLTSNYRCKGGKAYQEWIERLLTRPRETPRIADTGWKDRYDLRVFASLHEMIDALAAVHGKGKDVCLLASFTESDGVKEKTRTQNPQVLWAMEPQEYVQYWVNRGSNRLDKCASIYGCQGFERSYAGVIWGRDYMLRGGAWSVDSSHTITDYIGNPSLLRLVERGRSDQALELLYNRYRILLTRGIDGTFIYCEDEETREFLLSLAS